MVSTEDGVFHDLKNLLNRPEAMGHSSNKKRAREEKAEKMCELMRSKRDRIFTLSWGFFPPMRLLIPSPAGEYLYTGGDQMPRSLNIILNKKLPLNVVFTLTYVTLWCTMSINMMEHYSKENGSYLRSKGIDF